MNNINLLVISYHYPPRITPEATCTSRILDGLMNQGVDITLITSSEIISEDCKLKSVHSVRDPEIGLDPTLRKIKKILTLMPEIGGLWINEAVSLGVKLCKHNNYSAIYTRSMPGTSAIVGMRLKKILNLPLICHFSDPWPSPGYHDVGKIKEIIQAYWFKQIIKSADFVSLTCPNAVEYMKEKHPRYSNKFIQSTHIAPTQLTSNFEKGHSSVMTILHCGSFSGSRSPMPLLDGFKRFIERKNISDDIVLKLIGPSEFDLAKEVSIRNLQKYVHIVGKISPTEAHNEISTADVLVVVEAESAKPIYLPSKFVDYLAYQKPIIALTSKESHISKILTDNPTIGFASDFKDIDKIADVIIGALTMNHSKDAFVTLMHQFSEKIVLTETIGALESLSQKTK